MGSGAEIERQARCKRSRTGFHRWGGIHFTTPNRKEWIQRCRFCGAIMTAKMIENNIESEVIERQEIVTKIDILPLGLENKSSKTRNPKIRVLDINNNNSSISS